MDFEENRFILQFAEKVGFTFSYFIFTIMMFFMLKFTGKIPKAWGILQFVPITLAIVIVGLIFKRLLK